MKWESPKFSTSDVDSAGRILVDRFSKGIEIDRPTIYRAFDVLDNWRVSHNFPLNIMQNGLRQMARKAQSGALIAQRTKRFDSTVHKLINIPSMRLSKIQDIGGCRAVVHSTKHVYDIVNLYKKSRHRHIFIKENDYIKCPKESGYRSYHLVYSYQSTSRARSKFNDLRIEIQIRTLLQHYWATAVETVGTLTNEALKSNFGDKGWLRFFALMGTVVSMQENTNPVPNTPIDNYELREELIDICEKLNVIETLSGLSAAMRLSIEARQKRAHYYLITLDYSRFELQILQFTKKQRLQAFKQYASIEREIANNGEKKNTVLVSVSSVSQLKKAFPNYYLNTDKFLEMVRSQLDV